MVERKADQGMIHNRNEQANMKYLKTRLRGCVPILLFCLAVAAGNDRTVAGDAAQLISVSLANGPTIMPRTMFTVAWTMANTGTTTWSPTYNGYTMNIVGEDSLGAVPPVAKTSASRTLSTIIGSGLSIPPGGQATFTMNFIAPETPGPVTDTFQLNNSSSVFFGPTNTLQIVVAPAGSTNQYDRARAVSYANNYSGYVNSDGYFWTNGSSYGTFTPLSVAPTSGLGDDCAHFVSCCIGTEPHVRGGGLSIASRVPPTYGEPGAAHLVDTTLIAPGYAVEVFSLNEMVPGDLVGWNWEGDTNVADLDHVTLYVGNGLLAAHSSSALDVSANTWYQSSESKAVRHLIHIIDAPTIASFTVGKNLILSWTTNWSAYALYSSSNLNAKATWTKVSKTPKVVGTSNRLTNSVSSGALFYRLMLP
jgi:cell wall-associated NlpC family hydrolase